MARGSLGRVTRWPRSTTPPASRGNRRASSSSRTSAFRRPASRASRRSTTRPSTPRNRGSSTRRCAAATRQASTPSSVSRFGVSDRVGLGLLAAPRAERGGLDHVVPGVHHQLDQQRCDRLAARARALPPHDAATRSSSRRRSASVSRSSTASASARASSGASRRSTSRTPSRPRTRTAASQPPTTSRAKLSVHDYFFPGFTLGALYSPTDDFDIAGWYKWSDSINATGDVTDRGQLLHDRRRQGEHRTASSTGDTSQANCGIAMATGDKCGSGDNAKLTVPIPMEAKIGFRYHKRRSDVPYNEHVRDPMAQDVFDIEADLTWANDSAFQNLQIRFPAQRAEPVEGAIPINLGSSSRRTAPPNADVPHGFKDVYGVRLGGDYNVLPDQLGAPRRRLLRDQRPGPAVPEPRLRRRRALRLRDRDDAPLPSRQGAHGHHARRPRHRGHPASHPLRSSRSGPRGRRSRFRRSAAAGSPRERGARCRPRSREQRDGRSVESIA